MSKNKLKSFYTENNIIFQKPKLVSEYAMKDCESLINSRKNFATKL